MKNKPQTRGQIVYRPHSIANKPGNPRYYEPGTVAIGSPFKFSDRTNDSYVVGENYELIKQKAN